MCRIGSAPGLCVTGSLFRRSRRHACRDRPKDLALIARLARALAKQNLRAEEATLWAEMASCLAKARQSSPAPHLAFQQAVAQLSAGNEAGYRQTCQELLQDAV